MSHRHLTAVRTITFLSIIATTLLFSTTTTHATTPVTGNGYQLIGNPYAITGAASSGGYTNTQSGQIVTANGTSGGYSNNPGTSGGGSTTPAPVIATAVPSGGAAGFFFGNTSATPIPTPTARPTRSPRPRSSATPSPSPTATIAPTASTTVQPSLSDKISGSNTAAGKTPARTPAPGDHASAPGATPSPDVSLLNPTGTGAVVSPEPTIAPTEMPTPEVTSDQQNTVETGSPVSNPILWRIILILATITLILKLIRKAAIRRKPTLELILSLAMTILTVVCVMFDSSWYYITSLAFSFVALMISTYDLDTTVQTKPTPPKSKPTKKTSSRK